MIIKPWHSSFTSRGVYPPPSEMGVLGVSPERGWARGSSPLPTADTPEKAPSSPSKRFPWVSCMIYHLDPKQALRSDSRAISSKSPDKASGQGCRVLGSSVTWAVTPQTLRKAPNRPSKRLPWISCMIHHLDPKQALRSDF